MNGPPDGIAIARDLLRIGAFEFSPDAPFTWASGIESPVYCDNRLVLGHPDVRRRVTQGFTRLVAELHPEGVGVVVGTATAGIPHAALVAAELDLPMAYVRSRPKEHGRGRQIEGVRPAGQTAVVIEDLVSTGGSSIAAVEALRDAGLEVVGVAAIFTYGTAASRKAFEEADCPVSTLTNLDTLLDVAVQESRLTRPVADRIAAWRASL